MAVFVGDARLGRVDETERREVMSGLVVAPPLTEQVYNAIVNDICVGKLPPGTRLRQEALAKQYNVSRQPVQQALLLLHSQGFTRETGRRGLEVAPMTATEVDNLFSTRAVIDAFAARSAAERAAREAESGRALLQRGEEALKSGSLSAIIDADIHFHEFIATLTSNRTLQEVSSVVMRNVRRVMGEVILLSGPDLSWQEHAAILTAIEDGDGDSAAKLAQNHADRGRRLVIANVEQ